MTNKREKENGFTCGVQSGGGGRRRSPCSRGVVHSGPVDPCCTAAGRTRGGGSSPTLTSTRKCIHLSGLSHAAATVRVCRRWCHKVLGCDSIKGRKLTSKNVLVCCVLTSTHSRASNWWWGGGWEGHRSQRSSFQHSRWYRACTRRRGSC
jgi:hypothetical protein